MSKFLKYTISLILLIQFGLSLSSLYSKYELATNEDIELIKLKISIPSYYYGKNNHIAIYHSQRLEYKEDIPIYNPKELKFQKDRQGDSSTAYTKLREIYLPITKVDGELVINSYSVKKPSEGAFFKAQTRNVNRNDKTGKMTIQTDIQNLSKYNIEGDKAKAIKTHLKDTSNFNQKLDNLVSKKTITKEERNERKKPAYILVAVDNKGNYAVRDYVVDGKSAKTDF